MVNIKPRFKLTVLSPNELIYENEVQSVFLQGDEGEYEILGYHYPVIGVLTRGDIIIDWNQRIPVRGGIMRFFANECTIIVEEEVLREKSKAK